MLLDKQVRLLKKKQKTLSIIFCVIFILTFMSGLEYTEISWMHKLTIHALQLLTYYISEFSLRNINQSIEHKITVPQPRLLSLTSCYE